MSVAEKFDVKQGASTTVPQAVLDAKAVDWGVAIDAYLCGAGRIGGHYSAHAYFDCSGQIRDGETVLTPPVRPIRRAQGFSLLQSESGGDYYVLVSSIDADDSSAENEADA
ncbi:hypothetical protein [Pseudomonas cremoricolorata]|uniref:hypothetical protein n=1 Tax=Pseudomonas cremoricolorata TaxID=157783 RepID=UPI00067F5892|nr:hypothetical protein [Pseudomonas cremoricolorata]